MPRSLAIELTESDAKVVQLNVGRKGSVMLEQAFRVSFLDVEHGDEEREEKGRLLKEAFKQNKVTASEIAVIVPKQSATVRRVRLPSTEPEEIAQMAAFEAEKLIPFDAETHIISHAVLAEHDIEGTDVLIAAIDDSVMLNWLSILDAGNLEATAADVSSLAMSHGVIDAIESERLSPNLVSINIGWNHTDITLFAEGQIITTRGVLLGIRNLSRELQKADVLPEIGRAHV